MKKKIGPACSIGKLTITESYFTVRESGMFKRWDENEKKPINDREKETIEFGKKKKNYLPACVHWVHTNRGENILHLKQVRKYIISLVCAAI